MPGTALAFAEDSLVAFLPAPKFTMIMQVSPQIAASRVALMATIFTVVWTSTSHGAGLDDLTFEATGNTATVTACKTSASGTLIIPETYEGRPVTAIAPSAFFNCHSLVEVDTGNTVRTVGEFAFFGCRGLEQLTLGNNVSVLRNRAFSSCSNLTTINFGSALHTIEPSAFERCGKIVGIVFPASVRVLSESAFRHCSALKSIQFLGDAPEIGTDVFDSIHELATVFVSAEASGYGDIELGIPLFLKAGHVAYSEGSSTISVANCDTEAVGDIEFLTTLLGKPVTRIGNDAFDGCLGISSIRLPASITTVGDNAFSRCTGLQSINLPEGITSIGTEAFQGCASLPSIQIGNRVTNLGDAVFRDCISLERINIPDSVTRLGNNTFVNCSGLTSATLGERVNFLGLNTFAQCSNLVEVTFKGNLSRFFRPGTFEGCVKLQRVTFLGQVPTLSVSEFDSTEEEMVVYITSEVRRPPETLGGKPVIVLDGTQLPPALPIPPSAPDSNAIMAVSLDETGHLVLLLSGSNTNVTIEFGASLNETLTPLTDGVLRGDHEILIPLTSTSRQQTTGFFILRN